MRRSIRHETAARDAAALVERHDGRAAGIAAEEVGKRLDAGDVDAALQMDQVRREAEAMHDHAKPGSRKIR